MTDVEDPELELLGDDALEDESTGSAHAFRTAPIFTGDALRSLGTTVLPQRALYGRVLAQKASSFPTHPTNRKLYINTNAPFSALVCGVQGSGKSHSTSVLLESCLMKDARLGTLPEPLSAIVFHFDTAAGGGCVQPCEAAYLSSLDKDRGKGAEPPEVTVLVLPTNLQPMKKVYAGLPRVRVEPLHFAPEDISGDRLLAMMKVDENSQMPLYMEAIMSILRSMEGNFEYTEFRKALKEQQFNPSQKAMLNLRLSLLDSCLDGGDLTNRASNHFKKGHLTIIDLSSAFMDGSSACGFFDLILGLFVEADVKAAGKVVVLDEAHKYLSDTQSGTSSRLTDSLLSVIRQQRHLATRVIISTQEPTVVPSKFLDLCSFIIAHRFSSPTWLKLLANHVSAAESSFDELFEKIVSLRTGQAIMFAASAIGVRESDASPWYSENDSGIGSSEDSGSVAPIGQGYLHVQSRLRVTRDGGHSILAVNDPENTTRIGRVPGRGEAQEEVPSSTSDNHSEAEDTPSPGFDAEAEAAQTAGTNENASHASAGGTSAPAEQAAEAAAPPDPEPDVDVKDVRSWSTTSSASAKVPEPQLPIVSEENRLALILRDTRQAIIPISHPILSPPEPKPAPRATVSLPKTPAVVNKGPIMFSLTGDLAKFRPLVVRVKQKMKPEKNINHVVVQVLQDHFASTSDFDQILYEALHLGIIIHAGHLGGQRLVKLNPNASYDVDEHHTPSTSQSGLSFPSTSIPPSSPANPAKPVSSSTTPSVSATSLPNSQRRKVELTGERAKFKPVIQHLLLVNSLNTPKVKMATLRKRFGPNLDTLVADAVSRGFLLMVSGSSKAKVMLSPNIQFVIT